MKTIVNQLEEKVSKTILDIKAYQEVTKHIEGSFGLSFLPILEKVVGTGKVSTIRTDLSFGKLFVQIHLFKSNGEKFGHSIDLDIKDKNGYLSGTSEYEFIGSGWFSTSTSFQKDPTLLTYLQLVTEINKQALEKSGEIYESVTKFINQSNMVKHPDTWKLDDLRKALLFTTALEAFAITDLEEYSKNPKRYEIAEKMDEIIAELINNKTDSYKLKYGNSHIWVAKYKNHSKHNGVAPRLTNETIDQYLKLVDKVLENEYVVF